MRKALGGKTKITWYRDNFILPLENDIKSLQSMEERSLKLYETTTVKYRAIFREVQGTAIESVHSQFDSCESLWRDLKKPGLENLIAEFKKLDVQENGCKQTASDEWDQGTVKYLTKLYSDAHRVKISFLDHKLEQLALQLNLESEAVVSTSLKLPDRAIEKVFELEDGDFNSLCDIARGTLILRSIGDVVKCLRQIVADPELKVIRILFHCNELLIILLLLTIPKNECALFQIS
jgi:hypothetical protein